MRPRVVAFAGDQVSYARRYHVSPCPQGSSEWLLEKWVPAPTTLGVGSLGRGQEYAFGGNCPGGSHTQDMQDAPQALLR